jgi:hypothetical protein
MFDAMPDLPPAAEPRPSFTPFVGGLDTETPWYLAKPGTCKEAENYEQAIEGGYRDIAGYERFSGEPAPSDAVFYLLPVTILNSVEVGDTIVGVESGSTGLVIAIDTFPEGYPFNAEGGALFTELWDSPSEGGEYWSGWRYTEDAEDGEGVAGENQQYLVITKVTGSWNNPDENITVSGSLEANTDGVTNGTIPPTALLYAIYQNLAADAYRSDIARAPGQGRILGGFELNGLEYCLRNKAGGATAGLYVESAAGWVEVDLGRQVVFTSGGVAEIEIGDVMTGATSGATATVMRVQVLSGSWAAGTAAGWLTIGGQVGTFVAENLDIVDQANVATILGNSSVPVLLPDGRLDHDKSNFVDTANDRIYGADGVNPGWEFDGTTFAFVRTGMAPDTPSHVIVHKNHLFFSFGASVQNSPLGAPFSEWTVVEGAGEIRLLSNCTGFQVQPGEGGNDTLLIGCETRLYHLYGFDIDSWDLVSYRNGVGAHEWSMQTLAQTLFNNDQGITDLQAAETFGNFAHANLSRLVQDHMDQMNESLVVASCVARKKSQYRLFWTSGIGVYVTMAGTKVMGIMPVYFEHDVACMWQGQDENGNEVMFFGGEDGYVYQMDRGTSFDGEEIDALLITHPDHAKGRQQHKTYIGPATLEGNGKARSTTYAAVTLSYVLDRETPGVRQPNEQELPISPIESFPSPPAAFDLRGEGRDVSWVVSKSSDYFHPLLLSGIHYNFIPTVQARG